jgi:hypothetical protein
MEKEREREKKTPKKYCQFVNSGTRRGVNEICFLLGSYAAQIGDLLQRFRVNLIFSSLVLHEPRRSEREVVQKRR